MRKHLLVLLFLVTAGCSGHQPASTSGGVTAKHPDDKGPRLVLSVYPRQGFMPLRVSLNAALEGVDERDAKYYCLRENWDFGDGAVSSEQPNCEPFSQDSSRVTQHFFAEHVFDEDGTFIVRFSLGDPVKARSNQVSVIVLERQMGR